MEISEIVCLNAMSAIIYMMTATYLGLFLCTNFFHNHKDGIPPIQRMFGVSMLFDAVCVLLSIVVLFHPSPFGRAFCRAMDGFVIWLLVLSGESLIVGTLPKKKMWINSSIPYILIFIFTIATGQAYNSLTPMLIIFVSTVYLVILSIGMVRYDRRLKERYSDLGGRSASWFIAFIIMVVIGFVSWVVLVVIHSQGLLSNILYDLMLTGFIIILTFFVTRQKPYEKLLDKPEEAAEPENNAGWAILKEPLKKIMEEEKAYLNSDLSVDMLVSKLNTNSYYLYQCIHDGMGTTFYDYVNRYRIEEAKRRLSETDDKIEAIALSCGYNSSRSFLRVFSQQEDCTPTEWRRKHAKA